jgi:predicted AlkP superfamily pyrophosphatase or phosphodiesterase
MTKRKIMRKFILAAAAALLATQSAAQVPAPPKLLVVISVDQFSANLFDEYKPQWTMGLARLAAGTVFRNGYQSHAATETCPGHSTLLTGDHPSRTGIISNAWIDQKVGRSDVSVYCAEDESVPGTSSIAYKVSPKHLLVPTLGELMKARWPASRSVAVSGKDRAAIMMGGHTPDQRWYWTGTKFDTDLAAAGVLAVVPKVNAAVAAALAAPRDPFESTPYCLSKAREVPVEGGGKPVGAGRLARAAGDQAAFRASPELDGDTLALAAGLVDELKLGRGAAPDLLAISLSATDYVGHSYGTEGEEMCLQLTELDREIGDFLEILDSRGINYSVALTADHGGKDIPERERTAGVPDAARMSAALAPATMGKALVARLGLSGPGLLGSSPQGDIYLDAHLKPADRARLLAAAVVAYKADPQVAVVFTASQIAKTPVPTGDPVNWTLLQRARASFYAPRSGDFVVFLKKDITPIAQPGRGFVATHGSPYDYDRRVPILFWRPGATGATIERPVETTDIMPTIASMIDVPVQPGSVDGHCLSDVPGANCAR